jgi:hypothetical protein
MAQVVEYLPCKCEVLNSNSCTTKKEEERVVIKVEKEDREHFDPSLGH